MNVSPMTQKTSFLKIGEKVKNLRKKNNKTQVELANLLGLTPGAVSQIENSIISPSLNTLIQISSIFGKSPEYFMEDLKAKTGNDNLNVYKKKILQEYSNKNVIVSALTENEDLSVKIFSIIIKEKQVIDGPIILHKGSEFLYITEGSLYIKVEEKEYILHKGESILLSKSFIEKWHNKDIAIPCEFIYILL